MKRLIVLMLVSPVAFGQPETDTASTAEVHVSGAPQYRSAEEIILKYSIPDPVGSIELAMRTARQPGPYSRERIADPVRLVSGSISYSDRDTIQLQTSLLGCLPSPKLSEIALTTLYIAPETNQTDWFDLFTSYVTVPYGPPRLVAAAEGIGRHVGYASVEIAVTGATVRRAVFRRATGEVRALSELPDSCPGELVEWALEQ